MSASRAGPQIAARATPARAPAATRHAHVATIVREVLAASGRPLDAATREFFEPRFGHDFGHVRVHDDARAGASAQAVHAQAFAVGNRVVFAPGSFRADSENGRRLIAHELAHVVQHKHNGSSPDARALHRISQPGEPAELEADNAATRVLNGATPHLHGMSPAGVLPRAPGGAQPAAPQPFYQEALDALAVERRQIITLVRSQMIPESVPVLEKLVALCEAIERGAVADIKTAHSDFMAANTRRLPLATPSFALVAEMVSRMLLVGLNAESDQLRRWSVAREKNLSPGFNHGFSYEIYAWEKIGERLSQQIPETGGADGLKALDGLLLFFGQLHGERVSLSAEEIEKDRKRRADQFDNYFVQRDSSIAVYADALMGLMRETFAGIQAAFQVVLDQAVDDLAAGRGDAMLQSARDRLENKLRGLIEPKDPGQRVTAVEVDTTRSEFKAGGGVHLDALAKTEAARKKRSIKINFYDREQSPQLALEMKSDFGSVFLARRRQIALIEEIYGLQKDAQGALTAGTRENSAAMARMGAGGLRLHSDDDWRRFVKEKFELREPTDGAEKALIAVIALLEKYLRVFTTHTPYNIEDFGDNLLTQTFPRDLAGRLIHDCGVYALRVAYILSLLRDHPKLHLRFRYTVMPLHVGLLITGDGLPTFLVNNDTIIRYTAADTAAMRTEWNTLDESGSVAPPKKPATEARFSGEVMADAFISGVDLPYKQIDVVKPAGSSAAMKAALWQQYTRDVATSADKLFSPSVKDPKSPNYQFYLRYLKLLGLQKDHYNQFIVPFWNVQAKDLWNQHKDAITRTFTAWQQATPDQKVAAKKAFDDAVKPFDAALVAAYAEVQKKRAPIVAEEKVIQDHIAAHPEVFAADAEVKSEERVKMMYYLAFGVVGTEWDQRVFGPLNNLRSAARIDAPWADPNDILMPIN